MNSNPPLDASDPRRWLALASLVAVPLYVLPVGVLGLRGLWPQALRHATSGALALGMLSLVGMSLKRLARKKAVQPGRPLPRWKLPIQGAIIPEEFAASACSGR